MSGMTTLLARPVGSTSSGPWSRSRRRRRRGRTNCGGGHRLLQRTRGPVATPLSNPAVSSRIQTAAAEHFPFDSVPLDFSAPMARWRVRAARAPRLTMPWPAYNRRNRRCCAFCPFQYDARPTLRSARVGIRPSPCLRADSAHTLKGCFSPPFNLQTLGYWYKCPCGFVSTVRHRAMRSVVGCVQASGLVRESRFRGGQLSTQRGARRRLWGTQDVCTSNR
jgi:hypothetical protein